METHSTPMETPSTPMETSSTPSNHLLPSNSKEASNRYSPLNASYTSATQSRLGQLDKPDTPAMLSRTSEKYNLDEAVYCVFDTCCLWLGCTYMFVSLLAAIWVWCRTPFVVLDISIKSGCLRWSPWEAFLNGICLWLLLALLGLCMELIFFIGWLCFGRIREQQIEGAHYTRLGIRVCHAIKIGFFGTVKAYMSLLNALIPLRKGRY
ncbi:hypothetical protein F5X97DRAFT_289445 [Nemania serpens]|nr:hypothetical protein F5X97DRAFT_289445 [Nemania serpens]